MNDEELTAEDAMIDEGAPSEPNPEEQDRTAALEAELADAKAATLYAQAETQNVRRRLEKDAQDARAYASTGFARDILSVADNLSRALDAIPAELREDEKFKGLVVGLDATGRELAAVFQRNGITKIVSVGEKLDPNRHQAMLEMPSDLAPGTIVQEMQAGYMIKDRLLRPAMVGVAKAG
ncbi:nucleotide exchange factor GrpE [Sphingomonas sp.]|uniref:nucleotide exchange factor GrpE n=1 Tax=Sphingomonas sp. TaxID=28214 RepID=UPI0025FEE1D5|nr:nucleotide exchange factor GrpE [Sphingomonas sp.]